MNVKKIALIGAGELGSRHLQGLAKCDFPVHLQVVDPNKNSLLLSKKRFGEIFVNQNIKEINYFESLMELSNDIDLTIISTTSSVRLEVLKSLLKNKNVSSLILEKFLFQSVNDVNEAQNLIQRQKIQAYVNCPKRSYESFKMIKECLINSQKISYRVEGINWGLACNSIHFLDIMTYLTGSTNYTLDTNGLDKNISSSKRQGYIEFTGSLTAQFKSVGVLQLVSTKGDVVSFENEIESEKFKITLNEITGLLKIFDKISRSEKSFNFKTPFQSEMTQKIAKDILFQNPVELPTFAESAELHIIFLQSLLKFYNHVENKNETVLKIT